MNYTNFIFGGVSVALIFVLGFYFSNRRRSRKASNNPDDKDGGDDTKDRDINREGLLQKQSTAETSSTTANHNHVNGLRKRGDKIDHATGSNNNNNDGQIHTIPSEQEALILQNFYQSPLTPHKRLSIHRGDDNRNDSEDDEAATHFKFDVKPSSDISADNKCQLEVERKEKTIQSVDNTETVQQISEVVAKVKHPEPEIENTCVKKDKDKTEVVMTKDILCESDAIIIKADRVLPTTNIEKEAAISIHSLDATEAVPIDNKDQLRANNNTKDNEESHYKEISSMNFKKTTESTQEQLLDVNENDFDFKVDSRSSTSYTKDAILPNKSGDEPKDKDTNSAKPPPKLSKFKLFIFQEYADRVSDSILIRTSDTLTRFQDSQFDYADDLTLSILYEAQKEVSSRVKDTGNKSALDALADELVKGIIDKIRQSGFDKSMVQQNNNVNNEQKHLFEDILEKIEVPSDANVVVQQNNSNAIEQNNLLEDKLDRRIEGSSDVAKCGPSEDDLTVTDGGVSTDYGRPLSGYAKNLADFLADDDEFELSDDDFTDDDKDDEEKDRRKQISTTNKNEARDFDVDEDDDDVDDEDVDVLDPDLDEIDDDLISNNNNNNNTKTNTLATELDTCRSDNKDHNLLLRCEESKDQNCLPDRTSLNDKGGKTPAKEDSLLETATTTTGQDESIAAPNNKKTAKSSSKEAQFAAPAKRRQNKNRRTRGERPKSLYEQDLQEMLPDINKYVEGEEGEENEDEGCDNEVLDDGIKPVFETAVFLENHITAQRKNTKRNGVDDDLMMLDIDADLSNASNDLLGCQKTCAISDLKSPVIGRAIVIDPGCGAIKAGFSGDMMPQCYCPSVIGVPRRFSQDVSKMKKGFYVGDEAWEMAGMLQIEHPIKQDISNWSDVGNIYEYLFEEALKVNSNEHPLLLTELGLTSLKSREKLAEIIFERFSVPSFMLADQSCLGLYSKGLVTGLSLNSGFYYTQSTPIYEGHALPYATNQLDIGGDTVTNFLGRNIMSTQGVQFTSSSEKLLLNSMKQDLCYVALDPKSEEENYKGNSDMFRSFALPDGQEISVGVERFVTPEVMFDPNLIGIRNQSNVVDMIFDSFSRVDSDLKKILSENVVVSGGNSKITGFHQRLEHEVHAKDSHVSLKYADNALLSTWIGGSVLASIEGYRDQWISMENYAEYGSSLVYKMCF